MLKTNFKSAPKSLRIHLIGRSLWTVVAASELVRMHEEAGIKFALQVVEFASHVLSNSSLACLQLVSLKTQLKFLRKLQKKEGVELNKDLYRWNAVIKMVESVPLDCLSLPIEALVIYSKLDPEAIHAISPQVTPKLLLLFRNHHNESQLG